MGTPMLGRYPGNTASTPWFLLCLQHVLSFCSSFAMGCGGSSAVPASYAQSLHELSAIDIDGNNVSLRDVCLGKLTMIINVASK